MKLNHLGARSLACFAVALTVAAPVFSATIFRWVDDSGRTHVADVVPERYERRAERIDTRQWSLPAEHIEAAQRELARRLTQLDASRQEPDRASSMPAPTAGVITSSTSAPRRTSADPDCAALRRAYAASQECFAPFQNVNGTMKPGAFETCVELPDPSAVCGIRVTE